MCRVTCFAVADALSVPPCGPPSPRPGCISVSALCCHWSLLGVNIWDGVVDPAVCVATLMTSAVASSLQFLDFLFDRKPADQHGLRLAWGQSGIMVQHTNVAIMEIAVSTIFVKGEIIFWNDNVSKKVILSNIVNQTAIAIKNYRNEWFLLY